ncbi:MAG: hypothetical protein C4522_00815, partial [Desulfobacteraceae bacterium]
MVDNKYPVSPGERVVVKCDTTSSDINLQWTVSRADKSTASADITIVNQTSAVVYNVSGEGWLNIEASDPEYPDCTKRTKIYVGCLSCTSDGDMCTLPGGADIDSGSIHARFSLGRTIGGKPAGDLLIQAATLSPEIATPQALEIATLSLDVEVVRDQNGAIAQILAPNAFVDVEAVNDFKYKMNFYSPAYAGSVKEDGRYPVVGGATPLVTWQVENPDASSTVYNRLNITEDKNGNIKAYQFVWDEAAGTWDFSKGNGEVVKSLAEETVANGRIITETLKDSGNNIASVVRNQYTIFPWGEELVQTVEDPDGSALTTTITYYEDENATGSYGRIASQTNPDGSSWVRYTYDSQGRKTNETRSWLDASPGASPSAARSTEYDYTPVDSFDSQVLEDESLPRTVTERIEGVVVGRTYHVYHVDSGTGERTEITEQCTTQGASYGSSYNLRTQQVYYPSDTGLPESGRLQYVIYPDERMDTYTYERGNYSANTYDPATPGTFTPGIGADEQQTVVHGTASSPAGIADKTTREITVQNETGYTVLEQVAVYNGGGYSPVKWTVQRYDANNHLTDIHHSDGTHTESTWGCCNKQTEVDALGITTTYPEYDDLGRLITRTQESTSVTPEKTTTYTYDAAGRRLTETISAGGLSLDVENVYDLAGRLDYSIDESGLTTSYDYSTDNRTTTITRPGSATEITSTYRDGRVKSITGTGVAAKFYTYGVNTDGSTWTMVRHGSETSAMWEKTTLDPAGRTIRIEKPGATGTMAITHDYDELGRLERTAATGMADTLYEYDVLGNQTRTGLDLDGNGSLDASSTDRITESHTQFANLGGDIWQESVQSVYATDNSDTITDTAVVQTRLTGLGDGLVGETVSIDIHGNETISTDTIDRSTHTRTRRTDYPDSDMDAVTTSLSGLPVSSRSKTGITMTYGYDGLGRRTTITDPRTGTITTHYDTTGRVDYLEDAQGNTLTDYGYDAFTGRKTLEIDAHGNETRFAYNDRGQVTHTWGTGTYPVKYVYDETGRMQQMYTWRNTAGFDGEFWPGSVDGQADITTWHYHPASGLLERKEDAKGFSVSYTYTPSGSLASRTWARKIGQDNIVTTYTYDPDTGELIHIDYSDTTPDITFAYDRLGRQKIITDSLGTRTFAYRDDLQPDQEIITGLYTRIINRNYEEDNLAGRPSGITMGSSYTSGYGYDPRGRMDTVSWSVNGISHNVQYTRIDNSDQIYQITSDTGHKVTYGYEDHRDLKTRVKNEFNTNLISQYDYQYNLLGQRTDEYSSGKAPIAALSNKISGAAWFEDAVNTGTGIEILPEHREYTYDRIGNRNTSINWETMGSDLLTTAYTSNTLNQYNR